MQRFFFVHVQKTAGTTFFLRMQKHFARDALYPSEADGDQLDAVLSVDHLVASYRARREQIEVVTGHFPLCTTELLEDPFVTATVLRDPVERTLSYLRHHRMLTPGAADEPLEAIYDDPFRFDRMIHNHMVKMFSLTTDEMTDGMLTEVAFTAERLDRAKQALDGVDVVGVQERFDDFCAEFRRRFGWDLARRGAANRTEPCEVPAALVERIRVDNAMDIELYAHALALVDARAAATPQ